ncbi:hypothetical protein [Paraoerskovia sediminicola]|uniref:hypothetical protein n=1 Tax=Paraoerskovia sediminicola TaxID=1138587 RepID=UPI002572B92E|nr:hypothetical protein [Paraoerskovia sediminicola]
MTMDGWISLPVPADALDAGVAAAVASAADVPGSTTSTRSPAGTSPVAVTTLAWIPSAPPVTTGCVPARSPGRPSASISRADQSLHASFSCTRTAASTTSSSSLVRSQVIPATTNSPV